MAPVAAAVGQAVELGDEGVDLSVGLFLQVTPLGLYLGARARAAPGRRGRGQGRRGLGRLLACG